MLRKIKMFSLAALSFMVVASSTVAFGSTQNPIKVYMDNNELQMDVAPIIESGRTLVPIRAISEAVGADVNWDSSTQTVTISTSDKDISLKINSTSATVNNTKVAIDVPAKILSGRTLVPLRFVSESLGAKVDYNASQRAVYIKYFSDMSGTLKIGGSTTLQKASQHAADKLMTMNENMLSVIVSGGGSGAGITGAMDGTFHVGNASRNVKDEEKQKYPDIREFVIGLDGIAVIVNTQNPVNNLTKQQVFDIYTGKITNWKDVGGEDSPILVQTRETGSGTLDGFVEKAIHPIDKNAKIIATATPHTSTTLVKNAVSQNKNAIGFISMGYIDSKVKAVSVDSVKAAASSVYSGKWPYKRDLVVVTKGRPSGNTAKYVNFMLSPEGQDILIKDGYLSLKSKSED